MNKKIKKLLLSRETVRNLQGSELQGAAGGATLSCADTCSCVYTQCFSDNCSGGECPSRLSDCC